MTQSEYAVIADYINDLQQGDLDTDVASYMLFQHTIDDIFETVKEQSSYKSKFAMISDEKQKEAFDKYAITDDEENLFKKHLREGANEVYKRLAHLGRSMPVKFIFDEGVAINEFEAWDAAKAYAVGEFMEYTSTHLLYVCAIATTAGDTPASAPTKWTAQAYTATDEVYIKYTDGLYYKVIVNTTAGQSPTTTAASFEIRADEIDTVGKVTILIENLKAFDVNAYDLLKNQIFQLYQKYVLKEWFKLVGMGNEFTLTMAEINELLSDLRMSTFRRITPMYRTSRTL
jgi:hypothetical protein